MQEKEVAIGNGWIQDMKTDVSYCEDVLICEAVACG